MDDCQPSDQRDEWDLGDLSVGLLEDVLVDLMIVKYPGVEQGDLERLLSALRDGDMDRVSRVEADIAEQSARWMHNVFGAEGKQ